MIPTLAAVIGMASPAQASASATTTTAAPVKHMGTMKVVRCVLHLAAFVAGNTAAILKLKKMGGVWKVAKRQLRAKSAHARAALLAAIFGELVGIDELVSGCT